MLTAVLDLRPPAQPKKSKQESRFDKAASAATAAVKGQSKKEPGRSLISLDIYKATTCCPPPLAPS